LAFRRMTHLDDMRYAMELSTTSLQTKQHRVAVFPDPTGRFRYRLTSRVTGFMTGWTFIKNLFPEADESLAVSHVESRAIDSTARTRLDTLVQYMRSNRHGDLGSADNYLWDLEREDWVLVDGDDEL